MMRVGVGRGMEQRHGARGGSLQVGSGLGGGCGGRREGARYWVLPSVIWKPTGGSCSVS